LFSEVYGGLESQNMDDWHGRNGICSKIKNTLNMHCSTKTDWWDNMFLHCIECHRSNQPFDPQNIPQESGTGKKVVIGPNTIQAQIVADALESGQSINTAWHLVNKHEIESNGSEAESISKSAVMGLVKRLNPKLITVKKRKQESTNPDDPWCRARHLWCKQLIVRFGIVKVTDPTPAFDINLIGNLKLEQVVWWDETHKKCLIGGFSSSREFGFVFKRDKQGKIDEKVGSYSEKDVEKLNVKYETEGRFGLGCACVQPVDSEGFEGRSCEIFDYSGRTIITIKDYEACKKNEFDRIRKLKDTSKVWISKQRPNNVIYEEEPLTALDGIGKAKAKKIFDEIDVDKIRQFPDLNDDACKQMKSSNKKFVDKIRLQTKDALPGSPPPPKDHRKADNPYLSRYGDDWEVYLKKSMSAHVCVTDYVEHIICESQRVMNTTNHEADWYFYHDALSLMTSAETKAWMKEKGYLNLCPGTPI